MVAVTAGRSRHRQQGDFSLMGLLVSLGGAVILLFVVNSFGAGPPPRSKVCRLVTRSGTTAWSPDQSGSPARYTPRIQVPGDVSP